jgi:hypothetical protein
MKGFFNSRFDFVIRSVLQDFDKSIHDHIESFAESISGNCHQGAKCSRIERCDRFGQQSGNQYWEYCDGPYLVDRREKLRFTAAVA